MSLEFVDLYIYFYIFVDLALFAIFSSPNPGDDNLLQLLLDFLVVISMPLQRDFAVFGIDSMILVKN